MVIRKTIAKKKSTGKLKLRKESIRTLDVRNSPSVKGGVSADCDSRVACGTGRKVF